LFSLSGKTALVTGGSRGIGYMIAAGLLKRGVRTYICSRKAIDINAAAIRLGALGNCIPVTADVATEQGRVALLEALTANEQHTSATPALHILVNNAGVTWGGPLETFPIEKFDSVLTVNVSAPFALTKALLPLLRAAANAADPARIINIASIDCIRLPPWESYPYSASKAALAMLTRHLGKRLASDHITVNAIAPGYFPSKMTAFLFDENHPRHEQLQPIPLGRTGCEDDIAGATIFLASRAGSYITGVILPVAGGLATVE
jgi:NAD(P)-dependent dehydrogenase (short-subunit alcohol dehydrogenase family)